MMVASYKGSLHHVVVDARNSKATCHSIPDIRAPGDPILSEDIIVFC